MIDPLGTVTGIFGMYSVCLQLMNQIDDARNFEGDLVKLRTLFDTEKFLFKRWGDFVGLRTEDRWKHHHFLREDADEYPVIARILMQLEKVWSNAEPFLIANNISESTRANKVSTERGPSVRRKVLWALKDKRKFEGLLADVGALVQKLYNLVTPHDVTVEEMEGSLKELAAHMEADAKGRAEQGRVEYEFREDVRDHITGVERGTLLDWIGGVSTHARYDEAKRATHSGTCLWFQSNEKFSDWASRPYGVSRVLWFWGVAGIGKTHISATIIDYLQTQSPHLTAFFFCTNEDDTKNRPLSIIRSWISQLVMLDDGAFGTARTMKAKLHRELVWTDVWELFHDILLGLESCNLLIDGFDECLDRDPSSKTSRYGEQKAFLGKLLESTASTSAKILIVSRDLPSIRSSLMPTEHGSKRYLVSEHGISPQDTAPDIELYAHWITESKVQSPADRYGISARLIEGCGGMFLRLRLVGEKLERGMLVDDVDQILNSMPPGLNQAYKRNIVEISKMDKDIRHRVELILQWTLFAFRPLSVLELLHAIRPEKGSSRLPTAADVTEDLIDNTILKPCGSLIEVRKSIDPQSASKRTVHLVHRSVKEYLIHEQEECAEPKLEQFFFTDPSKHHDILHRICLSYLTAHRNDDMRRDTVFSLYSAEYWVKHWNEAGGELNSLSIEPQIRFFVTGPSFGYWVDTWSQPHRGLPHNQVFQDPTVITPLEAACWFGLRGICEQLLQSPKYNPAPPNALLIAAHRGHDAISWLLLSRDDVDVNAHAGWGALTALCAASYRGHVTVVQLLLSRPDIDVNLKTANNGYAPLYHACAMDHHTIVKLLLARPDVDVNTCTADGTDSPVEAALAAERRLILEMLLAHKDIKINAVDKNGCTVMDRMWRDETRDEQLRKQGFKRGVELRIPEVPTTEGSTMDIDDDNEEQPVNQSPSGPTRSK